VTRIAFLADAHIANHRRCGGPLDAGLNRRAQSSLRALHRAIEVANCQADRVVILGDLFDSPRPSPQLIAAVQVALSESRLRPLLVVGNHEQVSSASGDHALGPLRPVADVVDVPTWMTTGGVMLAIVPFRAGNAADVLRSAMAEMSPLLHTPGLLCCHFGLRGGEEAAFMRGDDSVPMEVLEDLIAAAVNDAVRRIEQNNQQQMAGLTAGMQLPPGFKMPF
jgi:hypothetical protein